MKRCDIEIWKHLLDANGDTVYAETLCCNLGMTRRQLLSRIAGLNQKSIIRSDNSKDVFFTLRATPEELVEATANILATFFKYEPSKVMAVVDCVSIAGYMTLDEVSLLTKVPSREVAYILYVMPNIVMQKGAKKNHYTKRCDYVSIDMGTSHSSAQLAQ